MALCCGLALLWHPSLHRCCRSPNILDLRQVSIWSSEWRRNILMSLKTYLDLMVEAECSDRLWEDKWKGCNYFWLFQAPPCLRASTASELSREADWNTGKNTYTGSQEMKSVTVPGPTPDAVFAKTRDLQILLKQWAEDRLTSSDCRSTVTYELVTSCEGITWQEPLEEHACCQVNSTPYTAGEEIRQAFTDNRETLGDRLQDLPSCCSVLCSHNCPGNVEHSLSFLTELLRTVLFLEGKTGSIKINCRIVSC